jgi:pyruvate/2-oxoglutarate/acetoin dehydrogenase E1 component
MSTMTMTVVEAARTTLQDEMRRDPDIWVLGEDVRHGGVFAQYKGLFDEFGPERIVDTPIAEATIVGAAVGAALVGTRPVVEMRFSDFALSAMDEIVNQAAKIRYMFGGQGKSLFACLPDYGATRQPSIHRASKPGLHTYRDWW